MIREVDHWDYSSKYMADEAEILGFCPVLSGVPDIVPETASALALGALIQPMTDPAHLHTVPLAAQPVAGGIEVLLTQSLNWPIVLSLTLTSGRLTWLTLDQRRV